MEPAGEGVFENPWARAYLAGIVNDLIALVEEIVEDKEGFALGDDAEFIMLPNIELLALLCERYNAQPPRVRAVAKWRRRFLKMYDEQIDSCDVTAEFKKKRRRVIEKTFAWLEGVATSYYEDQPG